ncbi:MAG: DoxX family membrane protein [Bacteroidales bacterium]|nr:DoxX family membrane protein [Bacteroidales bacterium]
MVLDEVSSLNSGRKIWHLLLRTIIGTVFIVSALAKLAAIDHFELYVYSYGFFPLSVCFVLARLCIAGELFVGAITLTGWFPRTMHVLSALMLLFFSLFLCYALLMGRDDSCQCFGKLVEMNPGQSLVKNAVLLVLVLGCYKLHSGAGLNRRSWTVLVGVIVGMMAVVIPFVVSVPDSWLFGPQKEPYNQEVLDAATEEGGVLAEMGVGKGRRLVAFVTPRCPYCKLAREKVDSMTKRHHIDEEKIIYVEPSDISDSLFVAITYGARPLLMLIDGQEVCATYHLRNVDEDEVTDFLR